MDLTAITIFGIGLIAKIILDHFKIEKLEKDLNNIGAKVYRLELEATNDRMMDVACTREMSLRLWKSKQFKKESQR